MFQSWGGREFQSREVEQLKALLPVVERQAEGTDIWMEAEDLRVGREWRHGEGQTGMAGQGRE